MISNLPIIWYCISLYLNMNIGKGDLSVLGRNIQHYTIHNARINYHMSSRVPDKTFIVRH